jgi:imidazolonepropionase-like amidohydrolase
LPVSAHATTNEGIRRAVEAGVDTIEHGYEANTETLKRMAKNGVVLCPTLAASEAMAIYDGWKPDQPDHPRIKLAKELMKNARASGVTIACGSDVGVFSHGDNVRELELMYAYGMSTAEVIRASTKTAAKVLRMGEELGQVSEGFLADLVVVEANPIDDLSTLRQPVLVIKDGQVVFKKKD